MAINEGDPIEDPKPLYTGYQPGFARDIIFNGNRELFNFDTLFNAQAYADHQILPPDVAVTQEWDTITEPGPATPNAPAATSGTTTTTAASGQPNAPKTSGAMIAVIALIAVLALRK